MTMVALFDMDGVIFRGKNFWLELHRIYGTAERGLELAERLMQTDYRLMSQITVEDMWKDLSAVPFLEMVKERRYERGAPELIQYLQSRNFKTGIVSSGPLQLAHRAQRELGLDEVRANLVDIKDSKIAGTVEVNVEDNDKQRVGLEMITLLGGDPKQTLYIGDQNSDSRLADQVGLSIAYNSNDTVLNETANHVLLSGRLCDAIEIIESWCSNLNTGPVTQC